jgi:hypothetical protein
VTLTTTFLSSVLIAIYEVFPPLLTVNNLTISLSRLGPNKSSISKFRQLQILVTIHNNIYSILFYVNVLGVSNAIVTVGGYLVIGLHSKFLLIVIAVVAIATAIGYIIIGIDWTVTGKVNSVSQTVLNKWKASYIIMKNPAQRRTAYSCPALKVRIGSVGFVTRITPILALSFCIQQTLSILLIK